MDPGYSIRPWPAREGAMRQEPASSDPPILLIFLAYCTGANAARAPVQCALDCKSPEILRHSVSHAVTLLRIGPANGFSVVLAVRIAIIPQASASGIAAPPRRARAQQQPVRHAGGPWAQYSIC